MAGLSTGSPPLVKVYHEKSMILPDVSRVLACLYEKDIQFSTVLASYKDILRLQARRSVPVPFYDGPTSLQESRVICRYIAETYEHHGSPSLLGKDVLERASIEQWLRHEEHAFDPPSRALFCHLAFPSLDEDMDDIDIEKIKLEQVLEVYEQRLGESEFLAGDEFTLADLVHLPNTHHIVESEKFSYLYASRKNVCRWWNTISTRNTWQQVVRDMKSVKKQYQMEELEQQEQLLHEQWYSESPLSGGRTIRIDPRKQAGTESQTILVPPPSGGATSSSFFTAPREEQPPPKTSRGEPSPITGEESNFFTTTNKTSTASKQRPSTTQKSPSDVHSTGSSFFTPATTPIITKMPQRTNIDKSTSKETSSQNRASQRSSKEAPNKLHLSNFNASSHDDKAETLAKPTPQKASKTSGGISAPRQISEVTAPDKPSPTSAKHEGTEGAMDGDERFSTKRLRKMLEQSDPAELESQFTNLQAPQNQETPPVHSKAAHVQDRKGQADNVPDDGRTDSTPSTTVRPPDTPSSGDERRATSPPKGRIAPDYHGPTELRNSTSINEQEPTPPAPRQSPTRASHASALSNGAAQDDKLAELSTIDQWRHTSPQVKQGVPGALSIDKLDKPTGVDRRLQPNTPKITSIEQSGKTSMDDRAPEVNPRQEPASDGMSASTVLQGSTPEARQENEAVKLSIIDLRDQTSEKAPSPPPFNATKNEKTQIAEAGQTTMIAPDEQLDGRALKNTGAPAAWPLPMKLQKNMDEGYNDKASTQQLSSDQSRAQPAENKKQGGGTKLVTEFGESKKDDFIENSNKNNTAQAQVTPTDGPSKQQKQSDKNRSISSEAVDYRSSISTDMLPSVHERSMGKQPMQDDRFNVSVQDNDKQGSEGVPLVYNTEQFKKRGHALPKSEEETSPDTQHVENIRSDRKADVSSKPTQLDGNEGDVPESQKGGM